MKSLSEFFCRQVALPRSAGAKSIDDSKQLIQGRIATCRLRRRSVKWLELFSPNRPVRIGPDRGKFIGRRELFHKGGSGPGGRHADSHTTTLRAEKVLCAVDERFLKCEHVDPSPAGTVQSHGLCVAQRPVNRRLADEEF